MKKVTRRRLLADGARELLALAGATMLSSGLLRLAFGADADEETLVVLFLRGGCDALALASPLQGPDRRIYDAARPNLKFAAQGDKSPLPLGDVLGFHPAAKPLHELYKAGKLAVVQAAGMTYDTRSHFDAQAFMELGASDRTSALSGWMARHLLNHSGHSRSFATAVALGNLTPHSLLGLAEAAVINSLDGFNIAQPKSSIAQREVLRRMYDGNDWLCRSGRETLDALDAFETVAPGSYKPSGREYPRSEVGDRFRTLARIAKMDLGLKVAAVDMGGWDTHKNQGGGAEGYFSVLVGQLAETLAAFYEDMSAGKGRKVTVVVMSEFGRRLKENASRGTDHGHGGLMLALGDRIKGGTVYGRWPGLETDQLYDRADLAVATDYRLVLTEILQKLRGEKNTPRVFPGYTPARLLGLVRA